MKFSRSCLTCLAFFSPPSVLCLQDHFNRIDKIVYFQGHRHPHNAVRKTVGPLISRCDQKDFESFRKVFPHLCIVHILHLMRAYHDPVAPHFCILQHFRSGLADSRHFEPGFYKDIPYIHCIFPLGKCHNNVTQIRATSCCLYCIESALLMRSVRFRRLRLHLTVWRPPYAGIVIRHSLQASLHSAVRQFFFPRLLMLSVRFRPYGLHLTVWRPPYAGIDVQHLLQASLHDAEHQFLRMSGLVSHLVQIVLDFPVCHLHTVCFILFLLCFDDLLC